MRASLQGLRSWITLELAAVLVACSFAFFAAGMLNPMLPLFFRDGGADPGMIGLIFLAMTFAIEVSEFTWGWMVDRIDLRIAMFMGTVVLGMATVTFQLPPRLSVFFVASALFGFFRSPLFIVGRWYMGVNAPPSMKAVAMASLSTIFSLVQSAAGFVSGFVTEAYGYSGVIWVAAAMPFLAGVVLVMGSRWLDFRKLSFPEELAPAAEATAKVQPSSSLSIAVWLGIVATMYFISFGVFFTYLPLFTTDVIGGTEQQVGILFGLRGLVNAVAMIPLSRLADRLGKTKFIPIGLTVIALSMAGVALAHTYPEVLICVVFYSLGVALYQPAALGVLTERIPAGRTGTAVGIYGLFEDVGWMIGPAGVGMLWEAAGVRAPFAMSAGAVGAGVVMAMFLSRRLLVRR